VKRKKETDFMKIDFYVTLPSSLNQLLASSHLR
jgi:hypothetical protein